MITSHGGTENTEIALLYGDLDLNGLSEGIIGCAIEVHRELGPGLLESVYETALCIELKASAIDFKRQVGIPLYYKGELISEHRPDLIVADRIVVEIKSIARFDPIHTAVMLTYLRVAQLRLGLLLNFNTPYLRHGVRRVML
jgi:GxxExxY protein